MVRDANCRAWHGMLGGVIIVCMLSSVAAAEQPYFAPATYQKASISVVSDIPIVHLYGGPAEMGEQHGRLLASQIQTLMTEYLDKWLQTDSPLPAKRIMLQVARTIEAAIPYHLKEEMHALSDAAGVSYDDILLANTIFDIKKAFQCSTMVAYGSATGNGQLLFARNLDFTPLDVVHHYGVVFVYHPAQGHEFISIGYPGLVGVLSGMNDAGLAEAVMEVRGYGTSLTAVPYAMTFRQVMEDCANTSEAIMLIRCASHSTANNLMLADAYGNVCVAELTPTTISLRRPDRNLLFATNHFRSPGLHRDMECHRYRTMESFGLSNYGRLDVPAMQRVLLHVAFPDKTLQSMVFLPQTRELYVAMGMLPAAAGHFVRLGPSHWHFVRGPHAESSPK
jgi:predicted choloylglycine hydrolase